MSNDKLDGAFIAHASEVLADTNQGLTGSEIVRYTTAYAVDFGVDIPITSSDFGKFGSVVPNKRTALHRNLKQFNGKQQFVILKELCELPQFDDNENVKELKLKLFSKYQQFNTSFTYTEHYEPTGWERVDRAIKEMESRLAVAEIEEQFQAIGMFSRETLITVAQQVFDAQKHPTIDGVASSATDAKRMLEAYLRYELSQSSEKPRKFVKAAVDFSNQLTHDRSATKRDAAMCMVAITSVASLIKTIEETK